MESKEFMTIRGLRNLLFQRRDELLNQRETELQVYFQALSPKACLSNLKPAREKILGM